MDDQALMDLVGFLLKRRGQSGIVYCHKRATAEDLAAALNGALQDAGGAKQFLAMPYHGKMSDHDRREAQVRRALMAIVSQLLPLRRPLFFSML